MKLEVVTITPKMASRFLELNTTNRPLTKARVLAIAKDIKSGKWMLNGDTIRVSKTNALLDGQHRLHAIVESDIAVPSVLVTGLDDEVFSTIDINGSARSPSDVLAIKKVKNYVHVASVAHAVLCWEASKTSWKSASLSVRPTTSDVVARGESDRLLQECAAHAAGNEFLRTFLTSKLGGYIKYATMRDSERHSKAFFDALETGAGLDKGCPVLVLRDTLMRNKYALKKADSEVVVAWCFHAYAKYKKGESLKIIRVATEGAQKNVHKLQGIDYRS